MFLRVPAFFLFALFCFRQPHLYDGSVIFIHIGARNARPFAVHQRQAAFYIGDADMVTAVVDDRRVVFDCIQCLFRKSVSGVGNTDVEVLTVLVRFICQIQGNLALPVQGYTVYYGVFHQCLYQKDGTFHSPISPSVVASKEKASSPYRSFWMRIYASMCSSSSSTSRCFLESWKM